MALARVKTWNPGDTLTAADLNAEFNNILNNALSLISPLTAALSAGGFRINTLSTGTAASPSISFTGDTQTGVFNNAAGTLDLAAVGTRMVSVSTAGVLLSGAAAPATPVANTLYPNSIIKGWVTTNGGGNWTIAASFNVSSITNVSSGEFTVNWATALGSTDYSVVGVCRDNTQSRIVIEATAAAKTASLVRCRVIESGVGLNSPSLGVNIIAIGA